MTALASRYVQLYKLYCQNVGRPKLWKWWDTHGGCFCHKTRCSKKPQVTLALSVWDVLLYLCP